MFYGIMQTEDLASGQILDLAKSGNKYVVSLMNDEHKFKIHEYDTLNDAMNVYQWIVVCIANSEYSFEDRCNFIK